MESVQFLDRGVGLGVEDADGAVEVTGGQKAVVRGEGEGHDGVLGAGTESCSSVEGHDCVLFFLFF